MQPEAKPRMACAMGAVRRLERAHVRVAMGASGGAGEAGARGSMVRWASGSGRRCGLTAGICSTPGGGITPGDGALGDAMSRVVSGRDVV